MKDLGTTVPEVVKRMAMDVAPDYPNVESANTMEQLYVIAQTITGSKAANEDLHAIIDTMKALLREWLDDWQQRVGFSGLSGRDMQDLLASRPLSREAQAILNSRQLSRATQALLESLDKPKEKP